MNEGSGTMNSRPGAEVAVSARYSASVAPVVIMMFSGTRVRL